MQDHERHPFALRLLPPAAGVLGAPFTPGKLPIVGNLPQPATIADVRREMEALFASAGGRNGPAKAERPDTPDTVRRDLDALVAGAKLPLGGNLRAAEPDTAAQARAIHLRRQLAAAVDHAAALLPLLARPRLVEAGFVPIDLAAAGDALEAAVALLDEADGDPDAEPWLGWAGAAIGAAVMGDTLDREAEDLDELTLGWSGLSQLRLTACDDTFDPLDRGEDDSEENEGTALESHGRGFVRAGADDAEEDDPAEDGHDQEGEYEHGSEDEEHPWRFQRPDAVWRAARLTEAASYGA